MADVDMTDAPPAGPVVKKKGGDGEAKKRFEVKKVRRIMAEKSTSSSRARSTLTCHVCSGTPSLCGPGTSSLTTAPSAGTISWICVSNAAFRLSQQLLLHDGC